VHAYTHDLTIFLRAHRSVAAGVSARATAHLALLARVLAPLHGVPVVTPALVALALRKVYAHRVVLVGEEESGRDGEAGWDGGDDGGTEEGGEGVEEERVELVMEQVLADVPVPL
jgi:MoxR-like ATPase